MPQKSAACRHFTPQLAWRDGHLGGGKRMKKFRLLLACASLVLTGNATAQNQSARSGQTMATPSSKKIFASVSEADLAMLVRAEGHTIDKMHPFESPSVRGKTKDGVLFVLIGTACGADGIVDCQGIMMQVRYDADARVTTDRINETNLKEAALSAWWDREDKTVGFTRYVVLDDGVTWMNIRKNLSTMLSVSENARKIVFK